jgi:hypothetical protein
MLNVAFGAIMERALLSVVKQSRYRRAGAIIRA